MPGHFSFKAMKRGNGRLHLADFQLHQLEEAVKSGFEARRGPLYNALRALNAFTILEIARGAIAEKYSDHDVKELVSKALQDQMEKELSDEFRFLYCHRMGTVKFRDAPGVVAKLETLVPVFVVEYAERQASGTLARKGGFLRWCFGMQEVGSIGHLLRFARRSLQFAAFSFDTDTRYPELERRLNVLVDSLPE